jgi:flavin reductase (DIM6/NTAB) family NADH-FMN oxidoreductase RutF
MSHVTIEPAIQYWGTPVVLLSTLNGDGTTNVAPMSSAWWLGWSCMLGLDASSQSSENLRRSRECVINLADVDLASAVDRLALTTGRPNVPLHKKALGYRSVADKMGHAGLHGQPSCEVRPERVAACKVQLEAVVESIRAFATADPRMAVAAIAVEARIVRVHIDPALLDGRHVDPTRWRPLMMSFRRLFGLGDEVQPSRLARGSEDTYAPWKRGPIGALVGKALSSLSRHRYGAPDDP